MTSFFFFFDDFPFIFDGAQRPIIRCTQNHAAERKQQRLIKQAAAAQGLKKSKRVR
jgi:hypothetical protein